MPNVEHLGQPKTASGNQNTPDKLALDRFPL